MPPAKATDAKADAQSVRERQIAAAAHARSRKNGAGALAQQNGSSLKELALVNTENGPIAPGQQHPGVSAAVEERTATVLLL